MDLERVSREDRKADEKLNQQNSNVGIKNGVQLTNYAVDQLQIISLLNKVPVANGGTLHPSGPRRAKDPKNGFCDAELHQSILNFQRVNNATLGIVDGWISPTGRTLKLLKAMAEGKGLTALDGGVEQQTQELLRQLQIVVTGARQMLQPQNINFVPVALRGRLTLLVAQLERDLARANKGKPQGNLPVQNNAIAIGAIVVIVIAAVAATLVIITNPAYRKAAGVVTDEILHDIDVRIGEFNRLMTELQINTFSTVLSGIIAVSNAVNDIKKRVQSCGPKFAIFEAVTVKLRIAFNTRQPQSVLDALMRAWMDAVLGLMRCLQENGVSPLELIKILNIFNSATALGGTLIDVIVKLFLKGVFPSPNLLQR